MTFDTPTIQSQEQECQQQDCASYIDETSHRKRKTWNDRLEAELFLKRALDSAVVVAEYSETWRPVFFTDLAESHIKKYFASLVGSNLPPELIEFLEIEASEFQVSADSGESLLILAVRHADHPDLVMLSLEEVWSSEMAPCRLLQQRLGLTKREAEVLYWISQGKTSCEIGIILGAASTTVKKHVQNLLTKLNVENRLSAGLVAATVLGKIQPRSVHM